MLAEQIHDADMVTGKAGQDLFLGIEKLHADLVVGQPETDKAVVDQALEVRAHQGQQFICRQIGRII